MQKNHPFFLSTSLTLFWTFTCACSQRDETDLSSRSDTNPNTAATAFSVRNGELIGTTNGLTKYDLVGRILYDGQLRCTGSLVAPDVVMTASYCVMSDRRGAVSLNRLAFQRDNEAPRVISGIKFHPSLRASTGANVALLKILWSYPDLLGAVGDPIYDQPNSLAPGMQIETVGYGDTAIDSAHLKRRGSQTLDSYYFYPGDPTEFLSFRIGPSGQISCNKDGGGPDFVGNKIVAITSYYAPGDPRDCVNTMTSIDVSIAPLAAWIRATAAGPFPAPGTSDSRQQRQPSGYVQQMQSRAEAQAALATAAAAPGNPSPRLQPTAPPNPSMGATTDPTASPTPQGPRLRPTPRGG